MAHTGSSVKKGTGCVCVHVCVHAHVCMCVCFCVCEVVESRNRMGGEKFTDQEH